MAEDQAVGTTRSSPPVTIAVMGTKGGVGKSVFVSFAAQLFAAAGDDVAIIDLDLAASGTTLAAEGEYGRTKPKSIVTAFDHVARKATNLAPYASGHSEELWDVTPVFLEAIHGGRIWLLPAREPANPGQSFNVVANVLPPKQRGEKLAAVVEEQTDRICQRYPRVRAILVDCGAERNPIYGAAFSKAEKGYILFGPNPEYFGEIKAVRDELLRMYASINPASIHAVANNVMSIADEQRCRAGIAPIPLAAAIPSDPTLSRAHAENLATHIDLGHESVSKSICDALGLALGDRRAATIEAEQVDHLSIVTLFLRGGGLEDFRRKLQTRWRLAVGLGVVAAVALTSLGTAFALTRFGDVHRESAELYWLLAGLPLALALVGAVRLFRGLRPQRRLLSELNEIASGATAGLLPAVARKMQELRRADPGLARRIDRWIEGRQCDERRTR